MRMQEEELILNFPHAPYRDQALEATLTLE